MKFAVVRNDSDPVRDQFAEELVRACVAQGDELCASTDGIQYVLNLTDVHLPRAFRRKHQAVFVFSIVSEGITRDDFKAACYTTLIRSLANMLLCVVPSDGNDRPTREVYFTTPEAGFFHIPCNLNEVYRRIHPIASSHFATQNRFTPDLPQRYWRGSPVVDSLKVYAKELDRLGVLPTPFPLREVLSPHALRHLYKIFGITGASYGNLSAREAIPELGASTFWMTGRGVDKSNIQKVGKDLLLVKGFDVEEGTVLVSVPPEADGHARVSVDAVEHELIYRTFPEVGAIVHVHAWIEGVPCTRQTYPCGTRELAEEVVHLLAGTDDPTRAAVGLKNHGLTITGPSLEDIFARIRGRLQKEVRMFS